MGAVGEVEVKGLIEGLGVWALMLKLSGFKSGMKGFRLTRTTIAERMDRHLSSQRRVAA